MNRLHVNITHIYRIVIIIALFLGFSSVQGFAAPQAICIPAKPGELSLPHASYSGAEITVKGVAKGDATEFKWDFGDTTGSEWKAITNSYNLGVKHTYTGAVGQQFVAILQVRNASGTISKANYLIQLLESTDLAKPDHLDVRINMAIDAGLWWLHTNMVRGQYAAGSPGYGQNNGYWNDNDGTGSYELAHTGAAMDAFQIHGSRLNGYADNDPYVENVIRAANYLLANTYSFSITNQTAGNPDVNGNGIGLVTNWTGSLTDTRQTYIGGICMMALASSDTPNYVSPVGRDNVYGRPMKDIVQDMVDFFAWGQCDSGTGANRGGWRYYANYGNSDMSTTQWPVLGMLAAETVMGPANVKIPDFVRPELAYYLRDRQNTTKTDDNGAFGYGSLDPNPYYNCTKQGAGLICLEFNGAALTSTPVESALGYLYRHWSDSVHDWSDNQLMGNSYAMYSVMKGLRIPEPDITNITEYDYKTGNQTNNRFDWFYNPVGQTRIGMATYIVGHQSADGSWNDTGGEYPLVGALSTGWNILSLMTGVTRLTPVAVICDCGLLEFNLNQNVRLSATCSFHQDPKRHIVRYEWDFGYAGQNFQADAEGETATKNGGFPSEGYYPVALRVTDDTPGEPQTDIFVCQIYVHPPPHCPVPKAGGPYQGWLNVPLKLDASQSWDANADNLVFDWDLDNDGLYGAEDTDCFGQPSDATGVAPSWTWTAPYDGVIRVRVSDASCKKVDFTTVSIGNHAPICSFCNAPYTGSAGSTITLDGSCSSDPDPNDAISYGWDFDGDGKFIDCTTSTCQYTIPTTLAPGDKLDIGLKVTDKYGKTSVCYTTVSLRDKSVALVGSNSIDAIDVVKITDMSGSLPVGGGAVTIKAWDKNGKELLAAGAALPITISNHGTTSILGADIEDMFPGGAPAAYTFSVESSKMFITNVNNSFDGAVKVPIIYSNGLSNFVSNSIGSRNSLKVTDMSGTIPSSGIAITVTAWDASGKAIPESTSAAPLKLVNRGTTTIAGSSLPARFPSGTPMTYEFTIASPKLIVSNVKNSSDGTLNIPTVYMVGIDSFVSNSIGSRNTIYISDLSGALVIGGAAINVRAWDVSGKEIPESDTSSYKIFNYEMVKITGAELASRFSSGVPITYEFIVDSSNVVITNVKSSSDGSINIPTIYTSGIKKYTTNYVSDLNTIRITDMSGSIPAGGDSITIKAWDVDGNLISESGSAAALKLANHGTTTIEGNDLKNRFPGGVPVTYEFSIGSTSAVVTNLTKSTDGTINIPVVFTLGPYGGI